MRNKFLRNFFRGGPSLQKSVFTYLIVGMLVCLQLAPAFALDSKDSDEIGISGPKKVLIPSSTNSYYANAGLEDLVWSVTNEKGASLEEDEYNASRTTLDISASAKNGDIVSLYVYSKDNPSTDGNLDVKLTDDKSEIQRISLNFIDSDDRTQIIPSTEKKEIQLSTLFDFRTYNMVENSNSESDLDQFDVRIFRYKSFIEKDFDLNGISISDNKLIIESAADEGEYVISAKLKGDPYVESSDMHMEIRKPLVDDIQISGLSEIIIPQDSSITKHYSAELILNDECRSEINWRLDKEYENISLKTDFDSYHRPGYGFADLSFSPDVSEGDIVLIAECEGVEKQKTIKISKTAQSLYEPVIVDFDPASSSFYVRWDYPVEIDESTKFFVQYNVIDKPYAGFSGSTDDLSCNISTMPLNVLCRDDAVEIEINVTAIKGDEQKTSTVKKLIPLYENRDVELDSYVMDSSDFNFNVEDFPSRWINPDSDSVIANWYLIDEKELQSYYESNKETYFNTYFKELFDNRDIIPERGTLLENGTITKEFNEDLKSGKYILGFMTEEGSYGCDIVIADQTEDIYRPVDVDCYYDSMVFDNPCITWSYAGPLDESDKMFVYVYPENKPYLAQKYEYHPQYMYEMSRMAAFDEIDTSNSGRKYEFNLSEFPFSIMKSFLKDGENNLKASIILEREDKISRSEEIDVSLDVIKSEMKLSSNSFSSNNLKFKDGMLENLKVESLKTDFNGNDEFELIIKDSLGEYPFFAWALVDEKEWSEYENSTLLTSFYENSNPALEAFENNIILTGGTIISDGSLKANSFNLLPEDEIQNMEDLQDGNYQIAIFTIPGNQMPRAEMKSSRGYRPPMVIASETITIQTGISISISGDNAIEIPKNDSIAKDYIATLKDRNGKALENEKFIWNLDKEFVGISIDKTSGKLSVSKDAKAGKIKLIATSTSSPEITKEFEITIKEALNIYDGASISISGDNAIKIPKNDSISKAYIATLKDKNGKAIENETFSWNLDKEYVGISIDKTSGRLSVSKDAKAGKIKLTATSASAPEITKEFEIIIKETLNIYDGASISISGNNTIEIPKNDSISKAYIATLKDKNGKALENETFNWSLDKEYVGISIDKTSGRLSVSKDAKAGKIKLIATSKNNTEIKKEFEITIKEASTNSGGSSGGGGSSHSNNNNNSNDNHYFKDKDIKTNDDKKLDDSMSSKGKAEVSLDNDSDKKIKISPKIIDKLSKEKKSLLIKNDDIQLKFAPLSLETEELKNALKDKDARVELKVEEISNSEKTEIMKDASLDKKGLDDIGAPVYDIKAKMTSDKSSDNVDHFFEPVVVTIELDDVKLNDEDIAKLTGVIYHKDENGNTIPVKLGGSYDKKTNSFTYYTDCPDMCSVVEADEILEIDLTINEKEGKVNHKTKMNDVEPVIINDRTMVPLRFISENLGANVKWVPETQTVEIDYDGQKLSMVIDQPIDGFDTPPTIRNDRTLVPSRYVSEKLGAYVMWFPEEKTVKITK